MFARRRDGNVKARFGNARGAGRGGEPVPSRHARIDFGRFEKVLRLGEGRRVKRLAEQAAYVTSLEPDFEALSDAELHAKTAEFKQRLENGEALEDLLFEAFAAVREARKRESGQRLFDVQLMGGIVLHEGDIAEMKTGEGKTFVASAPLYLNALTGENVHLVTVNDYLAKRDAEWNRPVFDRLGVTVAAIENMMPFARAPGGLRGRHHVRHELGVRLRLPARQHGRLARRHRAARPHVRDRRRGRLDPDRRGADAADHLRRARDRGEDVLRLRARREGARGRAAHPQGDEGRGRDRALGRRLPLRREVQDRLARADGARQGRARARDRQPLRPAPRPARQPPDAGAQGASRSTSATSTTSSQDGEVKIVDEYTGRIMEGRRWSEGLHQAIEAKEGVAIREENVTLATITLQNYFRLYEKLAGMTGTAKTEEKEFVEIYDLHVVEIPTNVAGRARRRERLHLQVEGREVERGRSRTSSSATRRGSRSSSARSPSRRPSTSPSCSSAAASRTTC